MKRSLLFALLMAWANCAQAYSVIWGPLIHCNGFAEAITFDEYDSYSFSGPGGGSAYVSNAYAIAGGDLNSIHCEADGYLPEVGWSAEGRAEATIRRAFRVVDGSGPVDVEIEGAFEGGWYGGNATGIDWSFGVEGISEIGGSYPLLDNGAWTWAGSLNYGQTYVAHAHAYAWSGESGVSADLAWDAPAEAQPVPEPASLLLLGLGLAGAGLSRRSVRRLYSVCIQSVSGRPHR